MKILSSEKLYLASKKTKGYNDYKQELLRLLSRDKLYTAEYKGEIVAIKTEDLYELQKKFRQLEQEANSLKLIIAESEKFSSEFKKQVEGEYIGLLKECWQRLPDMHPSDHDLIIRVQNKLKGGKK